ncbi:MAG: hypothetical protein C4548_01845 [Desulfobacteraceae bacterium]|jgi:hypothetical protein|nr:MAG: hypothetical protein C4548_01845 [Desulfobacteraceae bacterium]
MKNNTIPARLIFCVLMSSLCLLCLSSCEKKKEGKVVVTETEYYMIKDTQHTSSLNAKGKIRNIGEVDIRNVVVTGDCKSCGEVMIGGEWFVNRGIEKRDEYKSVIPYLAVGAEADFDFQGIAFYYIKDNVPAESIPEQIEVYIESFESAN